MTPTLPVHEPCSAVLSHLPDAADDARAPDALPPATAAGDGRLARGADARARLRTAALRLFARQGYARTSTREICTAAGVNVAAIHYHFGDKAGLYRDVYLTPIRQMVDAAIARTAAATPAQPVLADLYRAFLEPLRIDDAMTMQVLKLHFREQADPSDFLGTEIADLARRHFDAVAMFVARELGTPVPDDDARRLASCLIAIAADFLTGAELGRRIAPSLYDGPAAIDRMVGRLTAYGLAMLAAEHRCREAG